MNTGQYQTAALAIYALKSYGPPAEKADTDKVIARAAAWLEADKPVNDPGPGFPSDGPGLVERKLRLRFRAPLKALAATQRPTAAGVSCRPWARTPTPRARRSTR